MLRWLLPVATCKAELDQESPTTDVTHLFNSWIFTSRIMHANMMEQCVLPNPSGQRSLNCKQKGNHNDRTNRCLHESAVRKSVANFHSQHFHHPPPVLPPN